MLLWACLLPTVFFSQCVVVYREAGVDVRVYFACISLTLSPSSLSVSFSTSSLHFFLSWGLDYQVGVLPLSCILSVFLSILVNYSFVFSYFAGKIRTRRITFLQSSLLEVLNYHLLLESKQMAKMGSNMEQCSK